MLDGPLYFGCVDRVGHHLFDKRLTMLSSTVVGVDGSQLRWMRSLDGVLPPQDGLRIDGEARLHVLHGWTVIAFWDRSVDSRPNSNSVFFIPGVKPFEVALAMAREAFPSVFARFTFEVRLKGWELASLFPIGGQEDTENGGGR